jgi:hypothetical protein
MNGKRSWAISVINGHERDENQTCLFLKFSSLLTLQQSKLERLSLFANARVGSGPTILLYYAWLKLLARDKRSDAFGISVRDAEEKISKH